MQDPELSVEARPLSAPERSLIKVQLQYVTPRGCQSIGRPAGGVSGATFLSLVMKWRPNFIPQK